MPLSFGRYVRAGVVAGAAAGVAMSGTLAVLGRGPIDAAVALEGSGDAAHHEMYSRAVQHVGGLLATFTFGTCIGVVVAIVLAKVRPGLPVRTAWGSAMCLAGLGFTAVGLVPFVKYPADPPGIGDPDTIDARTLAYLGLVAVSILALVLAGRAGRAAAGRLAPAQAAPVAVATWVLVVGVALVVFPSFPTPRRIDADLLWRFRLSALGGQAALWAVLGLVLGALLAAADDAAPRGAAPHTDKRPRQDSNLRRTV